MATLNPVLPALDDWQSMGDNPIIENRWQPIETAPKDGTVVLLWFPESTDTNGVRVGWWFDWTQNGDWYDAESASHGMTDLYGQPTHWQPLPAHPSAPGKP